MERDISEIKLNINAQTRIAATYFVTCMAGRDPENE